MFLVFLVVLAIVLVWLLLLLCGWRSLRGSRRQPQAHRVRRLLLALAAILVGGFLLCFHLRFALNGAALNLSWPFVAPILLGIRALAAWVGTLRSPGSIS